MCRADGRRARKEKAWQDYWMSPVPTPSDDPGYVEILPTNQFIPMASTLPIARRLEALRRVIADPGAYALKLARRLARIAAKIPQLIARFVDRRTRGCADADALLGGFKEVLCFDSS